MITRRELAPEEFSSFYAGYVNLVDPDQKLLDALNAGQSEIPDFFRDIPSKKLKTSYAPDKWTILEILQHLIDTERIFTYRALCFARGEQAPQPGFDQDVYVKYSHANDRSLKSLLSEYDTVRQATISLFENLDQMVQARLGNANGNNLTARAAGFIIAGHELHHRIIIENRYL